MKAGDLVRFRPNPFNRTQEKTRKIHIVRKSAPLQGYVLLYDYSSMPVETSLLEVISERR